MNRMSIIVEKRKKRISKKQKRDLWKSFSEIETKKNNTISYEQKIQDRNFCEKCDSILAITELGFMACTNNKCCKLYKDTLDHSAEYRYYGANDSKSVDPTRCGMPINPLLKESSYGCKVICPRRSTYEMRKIKRYTDWQSSSYKDKSLYDEFQRITIHAKRSGIPKLIIDDALRYHKKASEVKTFRGLNRDGLIAASIYISCRINKYPRTAKEIATMFGLDNTSATKGCKNAVTIINQIEHDMVNEDKTTFSETTPLTFIQRYCSKLNMNNELTKLCEFIAIRIERNNMIPENTPHSIAAGIVYFIAQICNLNISKKDVNRVSEISEVTINKCYKKLETIQQYLIPKGVIDKYA